jgi:hypothetical protein
MERRLAAILAADVVRYSRLMQQHETDNFERLRAHRKEASGHAYAPRLVAKLVCRTTRPKLGDDENE